MKVKLKQARQKKGLSQNALAQSMDMTLQGIQKIEYGQVKSIPFDTLDKLCTILDCDISDILVRVTNKNVDNGKLSA